MGDHVKASKRMTASGQVKNQGDDDLERSTICSVIAVGTADDAKITLRDGNGNSSIVAVVDVGEQLLDFSVPMGGLLFKNKVYVTLTNVSSVVFFYR